MIDDLVMALTDGLECDNDIEAKKENDNSIRNDAYTGPNNIGLGSSYNLEALEQKYGDLPIEGVSWSNLDTVNRLNYTYAICKPLPKLDEYGQVSKYQKSYGKWNKKWSDLKMGDDFGVLVPKDYIVVDIDNELEAKIVYRYVTEQNIKTMVMKTERGLHFWFRIRENFDYNKYKIVNASDLPVMGTIHVDYRVNGGALSCLKWMGKERKFIYGANLTLQELDYLPIILYRRIRTDKSDFNFLGLQEGSRDSKINTYKAAIYGKELLNVEECAIVLSFINRYLLAEPLAENEMMKFYNPSSYEKLERYDPETEFFNKSKFLHEKCAKYLMKQYSFLPSDRKSFPLVYKDGYYHEDEDYVESLIRDLVPELTTNQVEQVRQVLHIEASKKLRATEGVLDDSGILKEDPYWINLNNGRLNILTGEFTDHTPSAYDTQRVPTTYDPDAKCEAVDRVLDTVFAGDQEKIQLFLEIVGTCLSRDNHRFTRSFFFISNGSSGKTTLIKMLDAMVGIRNICSIKPSNMTANSFALVELWHKLVNVCEELSEDDISGTDIFKQVVSGDLLSANRKYKEPVLFHPYATCIFAMNKIPAFTDKSLGMNRRIEILRFPMNFEKIKKTDRSKFDPMIADKITTEEAKSYLLNKAVEAYRKLCERGEYTIPQDSIDAKDDYLAEENPIISWVDEYRITPYKLVDKDTKSHYSDFRFYQTERLGYKNIWTYKKFKQEVLNYFSDALEPVTRRERLSKEDRNKMGQFFKLNEDWYAADTMFSSDPDVQSTVENNQLEWIKKYYPGSL